MSDDATKLSAIKEYAEKELQGLEGDPGTVLSPDGWGEREAGASAMRQVLAIAEPENWCPPHFYYGMSTNVRGEAKFTCELCGRSFVGWWADKHEGYSEPRTPQVPQDTE